MAAWAPLPDQPPPPTHIRKFFLRKKLTFIKKGPNLEVDFRYMIFFYGLCPPPSPWHRSRPPLSRGLQQAEVTTTRG